MTKATRWPGGLTAAGAGDAVLGLVASIRATVAVGLATDNPMSRVVDIADAANIARHLSDSSVTIQ
jgi:hypothetical protein